MGLNMETRTCPWMANNVLMPNKKITMADGNSETYMDLKLVQSTCLENRCMGWGVLARDASVDMIKYGCKLIPQDK